MGQYYSWAWRNFSTHLQCLKKKGENVLVVKYLLRIGVRQQTNLNGNKFICIYYPHPTFLTWTKTFIRALERHEKSRLQGHHSLYFCCCFIFQNELNPQGNVLSNRRRTRRTWVLEEYNVLCKVNTINWYGQENMRLTYPPPLLSTYMIRCIIIVGVH